MFAASTKIYSIFKIIVITNIFLVSIIHAASQNPNPSSDKNDNPKADKDFYQYAFDEAKKGLAEGGIPIGAALVHNGKVLGVGHNKRVQEKSAIKHGETDCIENAGRQKAEVYKQSVLYTTLSPCDMCTGTILLYKIPKVVIGENQNFKGNEELLKSRGVEVVVLQDAETTQMMKKFIEEKPSLWNEDIGEKD